MVHELDAVVRVGVVGGRDHDAAVEPAIERLIAESRRRDHMEHVDIGARCHEARDEGALEHVGRTAGILAEDDTGLPALVRSVVPADIAADLERMLDIEAFIGPAAEAVRTEIFHRSLLASAPAPHASRPDRLQARFPIVTVSLPSAVCRWLPTRKK